ncbi:hypothetical protein ACLMAJ_23265 [Nocardia sp. KC 131]|uniref:hypothetical protein n=1 Tax=Nocardia arseniciresistens TaxID=3392119 RepID=UPI00398E370C
MTYLIGDYCATVDSGRLQDATALLAEDADFAMVLSTGGDGTMGGRQCSTS